MGSACAIGDVGRVKSLAVTAIATACASTQDLLDLVKLHSVRCRTTDPVTAWTHVPRRVSFGDGRNAAPGPVRGDVYPLLGWASGPQVLAHLDPMLADPAPYRHYDLPTLASRCIEDPFLAREVERLQHVLAIDLGTFLQRDYFVLRDPGDGARPGAQLERSIPLHRAGPWWSPDAHGVAGVFAIDVAAFKEHFVGIGVAA